MSDQEYMRRVRRLEGRLYRVAQAMLWREADSLDAVQETVFRGWMKRESLNDPDSLEAWLMRILINQCRDMLRKRGRDALPLLTDISNEDRLCENLQLRLALKRLPERLRLPLLLHHLEGYSVEEVSQMLKISRGTAASRMHQARVQLRKLLDGGEAR